MYSVREITNVGEWDAFLTHQHMSPFVQSSSYGEFYDALGEHHWILGLYENNVLIGGSLILSTHAKRGNFLYLPYGPQIDCTNKKIVQTFCKALKEFGSSHGYDFIRVSPLLDDSEEGRTLLESLGYRSAPMHVLAENSWVLDVTEPEDKLLAGMKKNHRNLVNRCEREGVTIQQHYSVDDLEVLHDMLDVTEKRHNFTRFSRSYIDTEFRIFAKKNEAVLFVTKLPDGRVDAAAIVMFFGNMAVYRHSGSLNLDKRLPTSYLIQWRVIQEAKKRNIQWYNFWGVNPEGEDNHPFSGIGHFKRGFGGFQMDLLHCHDLPLTKKYWINWIVETLRAKRRGF